ncbi:hypothetical protein [Nonomuraea sp. NPDC050786]|uniref:hypothetical protein n=1 Tax=Nonomuraea sp. NPDC050786 TaxID=3154840 RepID=UPI0033C898D8
MTQESRRRQGAYGESVSVEHGCGQYAGRHNPAQPNNDQQKLVDVLSALTAYQDRLSPDTYAEFGRDLAAVGHPYRQRAGGVMSERQPV